MISFGKKVANIDKITAKFYKLAMRGFFLFKEKFETLIEHSVTEQELKYWLKLNNLDFVLEKWNIYNNILINYDSGLILSKEKILLPEVINDLYNSPEVTTQEERMLLNTTKIPRLYLYKFKRDYMSVKDISQRLSFRYRYILGYLAGRGGVLSDNLLARALKDIEQNKANILNLEKMFETVPKDLGWGASGVAYDVGNNKVLKLFSDKFIHDKALQAIDYLHKRPEIADTEAMIYDTGYLGKFAGVNIYYYLMEKMVPVRDLVDKKDDSNDLNPVLIEIISFIKQYILYTYSIVFMELKAKFKNIDRNGGDLKELKTEIDKMILILMKQLLKEGDISDEVVKMQKLYNLSPNWLNSFIKEIIVKYLTSRTDLHTGNLGLNKANKIRYFDPSHPDWTEDINYLLMSK